MMAAFSKSPLRQGQWSIAFNKIITKLRRLRRARGDVGIYETAEIFSVRLRAIGS